MNETTFLSALHEDPTDEVTWLALADWLDDNGQVDRAELLRLSRRLHAERAARRAASQRRLSALLVAGVRPVVPEVVNSIGMRLALIPPGHFRMGVANSEEDYGRDGLAHSVEISQPFYLGVFPVTQAQYQAVMGRNVASFSAAGRNRGKVVGLDTATFPVDLVSWDDAVEFCRCLSESEGRVYRLPTEAEWEYGCRAGTTTPFHFGESIDVTQANFDGHREGSDGRAPLGRPSGVGSYPPNAWGLYDVHGNVMEWCADWYERTYYRNSPPRDPAGPPTGQYRVARGGCWYFPASDVRSASRNFFPNHRQDSCLGFRVALEAGG